MARSASRSSTRPAARPAAPAPGDVLGHVTLVTGKEEFLGERTVAAVRAAVRQHDGEAEVSEANALDLTLATLGELAAPSLFSTTRCIVVRALENLPDESYDGIVDYAKEPVEDVALVLVHTGGQKGSGLLTRLRKLPAVTEVKSEELRASEYPSFVQAEARRLGTRMDPDAAQALVQAVGTDLRAVSSAVDQLVHDFPGESVSAERVGQYFGGRAEATSFAVADAAFAGKRLAALEELRWAIERGVAGVLVTSAFAGSARGLARAKGLRPGGRDNDVARDLGVPPWKVRSIREQSRAWSEDQLAAAVRAVAQADADIKGAASDAAYTLERLVLTITELRSASRS
ncbi:DNA polymerase III subunit delta [Nocardioides bruguierae]|uniref:DNA polymerase III subunit delta n=1 Tax=Nocardioides bruguierae TaxID=2945102 RepID=UPI0020205C4D|nr:DNA polymerase III subunit delta [Nocardioides bruguierae]MCL8024692.1 DNA polymerase III subunit delta [Nocardioides bruguierae]